MASNASAADEEADYVEFELEGNLIKGWLWRSPFANGDYVEVAVEWQTGHYEVFGVARPFDKTIAMYPHCSRAKIRHIKNSVKWWLVIAVGMQVIISAGLLSISWETFIEIWHYMLFEGAWWLPAGLTAALAIAAGSMTKQWMPFVKVAEKVFSVLELPNSKNIDLVKSSKKQRLTQDTPEFGSMYFRY
ncbi:putative type VI secretion system effector [Rugamonas rivuli]|uniref:putative type VI secretion system effector n=1 Tax=Rugamonas rivuli TaxID=2743358 RepID=UPI00158246AF|nr:putative type VI secretion system effector [Rugamonas rivuli]